MKKFFIAAAVLILAAGLAYTLLFKTSLGEKYIAYITADTPTITPSYVPEKLHHISVYSLPDSMDGGLRYYIHQASLNDERERVSDAAMEEICGVFNELELAETEWNGVTRRIIDRVHKKEYYADNGEIISIEIYPNEKDTDMPLIGSFEYDRITIFGRYLKTIAPWDGKDKIFYIKNYDEENSPQKRIFAVMEKYEAEYQKNK